MPTAPPPTKTAIVMNLDDLCYLIAEFIHETGAQAGLTVIEKELSFSLFVQWLRRRQAGTAD